MTENYLNSNENSISNMCCVCFVRENIHPMCPEEIIWYRNIVLSKSLQPVECSRNICILCSHALKKLTRFSIQCQKAYVYLNQFYTGETKSTLTPPQTFNHNLIQTVIYTDEFTPDLNTGDLKFKTETYDSMFDETLSEGGCDDDDVPLIILSGEVESEGAKRNSKSNPTELETVKEESQMYKRKVKRRRTKKSKLIKDGYTSRIDTLNCEQSASTKWETIIEESQMDEKKDKINKKSKGVKDNFSSRMVQETNEYTVIKLSKEQVLEEMQMRAKSDKYLRSLHKCQLCVRGFNFEDVLRTHMLKHSKGRGPFKCDMCSQHCPNAVSLRGHIKSHTTRYSCKVCGCVRLSRQHLLEHYSLSHNTAATTYSCEYCPFTTNKRTVIQRHVRGHRAAERLACERCGRHFSNRESLRVHAARHDKSKSLQCPECPRRFIYPALLERHIQTVHIRREYYCVECDILFKSPDNLRLHFKKAKKHRECSAYANSCQSLKSPQRAPRGGDRAGRGGNRGMKHQIDVDQEKELCENGDLSKPHINVIHE